MLLVHVIGAVRLELQAEVDSRIDEVGDRGKGHMERRRNAAERQADAERILLDLQVPEAVLEDDGHLVREALGEMLRNADARHARLERDVEMMVARKRAGPLDLAEHPADYVAQGLLHDLVVRDQAFRSLVAHPRPW